MAMTTYSEAVEQTITAGEQIHQIVNGTATTEVTVEDGSKVPSIRKALLDNFYFKDPVSWQVGQTENVFNQLRKFTDGTWWYAPSATASNPVSMGSTPVGDLLWKIYDFDAIGRLEPQIRESMRRSYAEAGLNVKGYTKDGVTLTSTSDVVIHSVSGKGYSWNGVYPEGGYVVTPETDPTLPGSGYVPRTDVVLREQLSGDDGAALIGDKGAITGQQPRTQAQKNADEVSIYDFGGVDDCVGDTTGTNNFTAIQKYFNHLASIGGAARFPKKATGGYYINGNQSLTDLSGVEIVADEGVYFVFDGSWTPLITKGIKCNRQIRIHIISLDYDFYIGPEQYRKPSEVMPTLTQRDGTYEVPKFIDGTSFAGYLLDTANGRNPTAITTTTYSISIPFSATSERKVAAVSARIGDEIGFTALGTGTGSVCAGVITVNGYALVEQRLSDGTVTLNKNTVLSRINYNDYVGARNQFNSAGIAVQVISDKKFSVLVNDVSVGTFDAGAAITGIAIGATGTTSTLVVGDLYKVENASMCGSRPLRVICLGDSTSDPAIPCSQFDYMKQFLASAGCQVVELNNLAVSGETSAQQLARFNAVDVSGYDYCIAQLGINDIQGGVSSDTYLANMEAIADRCTANGVTLIAGVPTLWYPRAESTPYGQTGQDTANSQNGAIHRNRLRKLMAGKGHLVTTSPIRNQGLIVAKWLANAGMDPVLMDNIHPTAYGRMMMGLGSAMAIVGAQNPVGYRTTEIVAMPSRWKSSFTAPVATIPQLMIKSGELTFIGSIDIPSVPANGTALLTIDKELINGTYTYLTVPCQSASGPIGMCNIVIDSSGVLSAYAVPVGATNIVLDGVQIRKLS